MKSIIIILLVLATGQINAQKITDSEAREMIYDKILELDKWYRSFADTIYFSSEYSEYINNYNEVINDSIIQQRSIEYLSEEISKVLFDKQGQKKQYEFISTEKSFPLFLGVILCKNFECQDLDYIIDPYHSDYIEIQEQILFDGEDTYYYKTPFYRLLGYQDFEHNQKYFLVVKFKQAGKTFKVHTVEVKK